MKKILLAFFLFLAFPIITYAANYKIIKFDINATLKENGDMDVTEIVVMSGSFNGYEVGIEYNTFDDYSASAITDVSVWGAEYSNKSKVKMNSEDFHIFNKVGVANNGDKSKYTETFLRGKNNYRMYNHTENGVTAFLLQYTLKDVAILHNDVGEIYWNFFSTDFRDDIKDLNIHITIPNILKESDFHWWFHGPLAGNSSMKIDGAKTVIDAHLDGLDAGTALDFRILLPTSLFSKTDMKKIANDTVKDRIIAEEDEIVRKDCEEIAHIKRIYNTTVISTILFYIILVITWIYTYLKFDKERKPVFNLDYSREFIDDYNVEVIDFLINRNITPNAMSASIMNLIYKKNITAEEIINENNKSRTDYKFTLQNKDNLNESEQILIDFLFTKVGQGNTFSTIDLKKYASSTRTCDRFMKNYTDWKNNVIKEGEKQNFFEKGSSKAIYALIIFVLASLVSGFAFRYEVEFIPSYFVLFTAVIYIIYLCLCSKKSEKGIEHYAKWMAFKKFLQDFGSFSTKELPEVILWERYLVYATIFGLADKVEKDMNVKIYEIDPTNSLGMDGYYYYPHVHVAPVISSSIRSAYNSSQAAINSKNASASGGSFGGHGGGFSSGGGGGGGGRSGGGF